MKWPTFEDMADYVIEHDWAYYLAMLLALGLGLLVGLLFVAVVS